MVKWRGRRGSKNVEDRRGAGGGVSGIAFLLIRLILSRFGIAGLVVLVGGFFVLQAVGINPVALLEGRPQAGARAPASDETAQFVGVVLAETEIVWEQLFAQQGLIYEQPTLVLFSGQSSSACGFASAAVGPFYCPADRKVYLDTNFFAELARRFGAPGDFAAAYVIAHEVGHHVQTLIGVSKEVQAAQAGAGEAGANALQVRMELQADCYAGVWAHSAQRMSDFLDAGDLEEGLQAASAIGDDTLQREAGRRVAPESFTHGTSAQRVRWFSDGYRTGDPDACDTFGDASP